MTRRASSIAGSFAESGSRGELAEARAPSSAWQTGSPGSERQAANCASAAPERLGWPYYRRSGGVVV